MEAAEVGTLLAATRLLAGAGKVSGVGGGGSARSAAVGVQTCCCVCMDHVSVMQAFVCVSASAPMH